MTPVADTLAEARPAFSMSALIGFLRTELAPRPGRLQNVLRMTAFTVLTVILAEVYQIPAIGLAAYVVFLVSQEEVASTILGGVLFTLSITVSIFFALGIYTISAGEPGLRLPLMAALVFSGMFISRASPLGMIGFFVGFLTTIALTLIDTIPTTGPRSSLNSSADTLTRSVLWYWVVVMIPVVVVVLGNILCGRDPLNLLKQEASERLECGGRLLKGQRKAGDRERISVYAKLGTSDLLKYLKTAGFLHKKLKQEKSVNQTLVSHLACLMILIDEWCELKVQDPHLLAAASECGILLLQIKVKIKDSIKPGARDLVFRKPLLRSNDSVLASDGKAFLLLSKIIELSEAMSALLLSPTSLVGREKPYFSALYPDAFSNPVYLRYALKTTLAIFITYISYNLVAWPGIHTCMITCFFVSLGSFGETTHKMTLRLSGAVIGGALGLATVVFVMPYLTTITDLCLVLMLFCPVAAWVSTSSERLSYAGLQCALAFFLCIFVGYGPTIELSQSRDRVVGVIFGNLVTGLVFSQLWPVSALDLAKRSLLGAIEQLSKFFLLVSEKPTSDQLSQEEKLFFKFDSELTEARNFASLDPFEPRSLKQNGTFSIDMQLIDRVYALCAPAAVLDRQNSLLDGPLDDPFDDNEEVKQHFRAYHQALSSWLLNMRSQVETGKVIASPPSVAPFVRSLETAAARSSKRLELLASAKWYSTLDQRVRHLDNLIGQSLEVYQDVRGAA
jgi:multidrug resistance protein MdtO